MPFIMGSDITPWGVPDYYTFGGLAFIIFGLVFYMRDSIKKSNTIKLEYTDQSSLLPPSIDKDYRSAPLPIKVVSESTFGISKVDIRYLNLFIILIIHRSIA